MSDFLRLVCSTCRACPTLITLDPGADQCEHCSLKRTIKVEAVASDHPLAKSVKRERYDETQQQSSSPPAPMVTIPVAKSNATADMAAVKRDTTKLEKLIIPPQPPVVAVTATSAASCATPADLVGFGVHREIAAASAAAATVTAGLLLFACIHFVISLFPSNIVWR